MEAGEHTDRIIIKEARQDALKLTKFHLEGFRAQERYVSNLAEDIEDNYTSTVKLVATYGEQIGHSSVVRLDGGAKLAEDEEHQQQRKDYAKARHLAERLERAIEDLPQAERVILEGRYINSNREPWTHIAELIGYDERYCYKLHNKGLRYVAVSLFGIAEVLIAEEEKRNRRDKDRRA